MLLAAWGATMGQRAFVTSTVADVTGSPARTFRQWVVNTPTRFAAPSMRAEITIHREGMVGKKLEMVPSFRYIHVWRDDNALDVGLGDHILRTGVGVRFWTSH